MIVDKDYLPHSDHWLFVQNGVLGIMTRPGSTTGRGLGHKHGDMLDKFGPKPLSDLVIDLAAR